MSDMYAIKGTTLTALGDAIRDRCGLGPITQTTTINSSHQTHLFEFPISTSGKYKYIIKISNVIGDKNTIRFTVREYVSKNTLYTEQMFESLNTEPMEFDSEENQIYIYTSMVSKDKESCDINIACIQFDENGDEFKFTPLEMANAITNTIPYPVVEDIKILRNGTYTPPTGVDGFNSVEVEVAGAINVEPIVLTAEQMYGCSGSLASSYVRLFGDTVSTNKITNGSNMFLNYQNESIPFELNFSYKGTAYYENMTYLFASAKNLKTLPKINNCRPSEINHMFNNCHSLREIPEDYFDDFDWSYMENATSAYNGSMAYLYSYCRSLRKAPLDLLNHVNKNCYQSYVYFYNGFYGCSVLDELVGLPLPYTATYTSNIFYYTLNECYRLKRLTFEMNEDGSPKVMPWKNQTLDLSASIGYLTYANNRNYILDYNSGITRDKEVYDDATYAALKDDADWYAASLEYSRYNKTSAVETINSLPDCSATGTNTIKFKGDAGSKTDGGAINTLTEAEIAVAAAKGWTISFT